MCCGQAAAGPRPPPSYLPHLASRWTLAWGGGGGLAAGAAAENTPSTRRVDGSGAASSLTDRDNYVIYAVTFSNVEGLCEASLKMLPCQISSLVLSGWNISAKLRQGGLRYL